MTLYQKTTIMIAVLTLIMSANIDAVYAGPAEAEIMMQNFFQEKREDFLETFEDSNYEKWKYMVGKNSAIAKIINQDKFNQFIKARILARQGKYEESVKIASALKQDIKRLLEKK